MTNRKRSTRLYLLTQFCGRILFLAALLLLVPAPAGAYIGPGAGIAFVSSFLVVLATFFLALLTLLTWPFRSIIWAFTSPTFS